MTGFVDINALVDDLYGSQSSGISALDLVDEVLAEDYGRYQTDLIGFCQDVLGMTPWRGENGQPGQYEVLEAVQRSVAAQLAGDETAAYIFHVEAGHGIGKTYGIEAPAIIWFYECFRPSVTHSTANTALQVNDLLWKDVRTHAQNARDRGHRVLRGLLPKESRAEIAANHFATGFTTNNAGGKGTERAQGQHNKYHLYLFDEADGIPEFMYGAVKRMLTGNTVRLWFLIANPKSTTSPFQAMKTNPAAICFRLSALNFPNVVHGQEIVPGGTKRSTIATWIEDREEFGCEVVPRHDEARHTFTLDWDVIIEGRLIHAAGTIFQPLRGFQYGVMGIPPESGSGDTFVLTGRVDAALVREVELTPESIQTIQIGVDCGRFGDDSGKVYAFHRRELNLRATIQGGEQNGMTVTRRYLVETRQALMLGHAAGATAASVRVDGGGGYGGGIVDGLLEDEELQALFPDGFEVHEVNNDGPASPDGERTYANIVTEMYALADEVLKVTRIGVAGKALKRDLTTRRYGYVTKGDRSLKRLEKKELFKKRSGGESPDDGDGAVLALAPERLFQNLGAATAGGAVAAMKGALAAAQAAPRPVPVNPYAPKRR